MPCATPGGVVSFPAMKRRLDFSDHRRELDNNRYIYAVVSRRSRGLSIGINLNPDKVCNFDCPYCQVDRSTPGKGREVDLDGLRRELDALLGLVTGGELWQLPPFDSAEPALRRVNDLAFAGDGEPTSSPAFPDAVDLVADLRDGHGLGAVPLHLLSNATLFHRPAVAAGLRRLDARGGVIWAKLDAGTEAYFHEVDGTRLPFQRILDNLLVAARERPIVLQCMFLTLDGVGPSDAEIAAWAGRIADIQRGGGQIRQVQVYTVARRPAEARVGALPLARLEQIAAAAAELGVEVAVFPGVG